MTDSAREAKVQADAQLVAEIVAQRRSRGSKKDGSPMAPVRHATIWQAARLGALEYAKMTQDDLSAQSDEVKTLRAAIEQAALWFDQYGAEHERRGQRVADLGERLSRADKARRNYERASTLRRVLFPDEERSA